PRRRAADEPAGGPSPREDRPRARAAPPVRPRRPGPRGRGGARAPRHAPRRGLPALAPPRPRRPPPRARGRRARRRGRARAGRAVLRERGPPEEEKEEAQEEAEGARRRRGRARRSRGGRRGGRGMSPFPALLGIGTILLAATALAQSPPHGDAPADTAAVFDPGGHFAVYAADGRPTDLDAVVAALGGADVVFLGEIHNDPTAHALQRRLLEAAHRRYGAQRPVALALEMFERDVQLVLDEYLAGLVRERDFLEAARPWSSYATDYRPAVEYAKAHGLPVIAANAPARYVSRVGREGLAGLDALPEAARAFLAPLPLAPPSDPLAA